MHPDDPDFDLVPAAVEGDLDAFEALVRRYQSRMVSFARTLTARPEDAEDLAQEVFVRVFKALGRTHPAAVVRLHLAKSDGQIVAERIVNHRDHFS